MRWRTEMFYSLLELFKRSHIFCILRFFWIDPRYLSRIRKHPAYQCTLLAMVYRKMSSAPYLVAALFLYIENGCTRYTLPLTWFPYGSC